MSTPQPGSVSTTATPTKRKQDKTPTNSSSKRKKEVSTDEEEQGMFKKSSAVCAYLVHRNTTLITSYMRL